MVTVTVMVMAGGSSSAVPPHKSCRSAVPRLWDCHPFISHLGEPGTESRSAPSGALCSHAGGRCWSSVQTKFCPQFPCFQLNRKIECCLYFLFLPQPLPLGISRQTLLLPAGPQGWMQTGWAGSSRRSLTYCLVKLPSSLCVQCTSASPGSADRRFWMQFLTSLGTSYWIQDRQISGAPCTWYSLACSNGLVLNHTIDPSVLYKSFGHLCAFLWNDALLLLAFLN